MAGRGGNVISVVLRPADGKVDETKCHEEKGRVQGRG